MKTIWGDGLAGAGLFRYLKKNKTAIMDFKKSVTKQADIVSVVPGVPSLPSHLMKHKGYRYANDDSKGELERTIVMNSYNWLDSHDDAHQNNLFAKSIADRGNRIPHLHDHEFKIAARVGMPLSWSEKVISWSELGVQKDGDTMALLLESQILKELNPAIYKEYLTNRIDQHSVSMSYVDIQLAINDADYEEEYKAWKQTFDKLGNQEKALEQGYYFPVYQARLYEGSAVLLGSNEITPTLGERFEPVKSTQIEKPVRAPLDIPGLLKLYMS